MSQKGFGSMSCMCLCKDTNFKANHNDVLPISQYKGVVCAYAKILILKQITTHNLANPFRLLLYVPMQRY